MSDDDRDIPEWLRDWFDSNGSQAVYDWSDSSGAPWIVDLPGYQTIEEVSDFQADLDALKWTDDNTLEVPGSVTLELVSAKEDGIDFGSVTAPFRATVDLETKHVSLEVLDPGTREWFEDTEQLAFAPTNLRLRDPDSVQEEPPGKSRALGSMPTEDDLRELPRFAVIAIAARAARRVWHLVSGLPEQQEEASRVAMDAIALATQCAAEAVVEPEKLVEAHKLVSALHQYPRRNVDQYAKDDTKARYEAAKRALGACREAAEAAGAASDNVETPAYNAIQNAIEAAQAASSVGNPKGHALVASAIKSDITHARRDAALMNWDHQTPVSDGAFGSLWNESTPDWWEPIDADNEVPPQATPQESGSVLNTRMKLQREADPDETCLRAHDYAKAICHLLRNATGEFCLALYGHWGRGKTFIMTRVAEILNGSDYAVLSFSAWKYRSQSEIWAYLYETVAAYVRKQSRWRRNSVALRVGVLKHGWVPLFMGVLGVTVSSIPLGFQISVATVLIGALGLTGLVFAMRFFFSLKLSGLHLWHKYALLSSHREKLGLQALIGDDLSALVRGLIPERENPRWPWFATLCAFATSGAVLTLSLWPRSSELAVAIENLVGVPLSATEWLAALAGIAVFAMGLAICGLAVWGWNGPRKILLVVDDVDRNSYAEMVDFIDSVKLMIEEEAINQRVQVVVLVDEAILRDAIGRRMSGAQLSTERLVDEHLQKLFVCHLRLPPLTPGDVEDVAKRYVNSERHRRASEERVTREGQLKKQLRDLEAEAVSLSVPTSEYETRVKRTVPWNTAIKMGWEGHALEVEERKRSRGEVVQLELARRERLADNEQEKDRAQVELDRVKPVPDNVTALSDGGEFTFDELESTLLPGLIAKLSKESGERHWGPRTVRAFLFKYQIARFLAAQLGLNISTQDLVEALANGIRSAEAGEKAVEDRQRVLLRTIIEHVL